MEKHIILRNDAAVTRDPFLGSFSMTPSIAPGTSLSVDVETIDRRDIPALTRDASVVAVAPAVPMKLVEPVAVENGAQPAAAGVEWGISAVGADRSPFTGNGVVVAVLDTGIDRNHPAFAGVEIIERDFTGEGNGDEHGHGTHCAGTIFGRDLAGRRIGVARGVRKALIGKVLGSRGGSSASIVSAIQWAVENGAHVISMSLGIDFPGLVAELAVELPTEIATSRALEGYRQNVQLFERLAALVQARGNGFGQPTIIIAAAGNESMREQDSRFEVAVSPPAVAAGVISVAALGRVPAGLRVADFSNTGANVSGPGVDIISAAPGGGLARMSGTSMATPHVAGVAALWAEKLRTAGSLNGLLLTSRLIASGVTTNIGAGFDPFDVGSGMVQSPQQ
jgi:subtilisin family serine protease